MNLETCKKALLFKLQDLRNVPMPNLVARVDAYMSSCNQVSVEESAMMFYMLNKGFGDLCLTYDKKEELPPEAEKLAMLYLDTASESSARLFYYMLLVTTREARHLHNSDSFKEKVKTKYGEVFFEFSQHLKGKGSDGAVQYLRKASKYLQGVTVGQYTEGITYIFNNGNFSGGYGGKPWGNIADTLRKMVFGETSLEIMNDTAWTLAHNNGPMFNKGMLYNGYTHDIYKILDVQRSGQIAELVAENYSTSTISGVTSVLRNAYVTLNNCFPSRNADHVDWFKVEALGSLKKYPNEKKAQAAKHGKPSHGENYSGVPPTSLFVNEYEYATILSKRAA